ncbi:V-type ATPase subunit [Nanoarchaeota archaeon]
MQKLKLGFYPYTFVRTNVMRSLLLKREDYDRIMKMTVAEITRHLQELHYRDDINRLGGAYSTTELIEMALTHNLDRSFRKLRMICGKSTDLSVLVDAYMQRYDVYNIKTILRVLQTGQEKEEGAELISGAGTISAEFYKEVLRGSDSVRSALERLMPTAYVNKSMLDMELRVIENELDKLYYQYLLELADRIPEPVNLFRDFIEAEIEMLNLMTLVRLRREGVAEDTVRSLLILPKNVLRRSFVTKLLDVTKVEDILKYLEKTKYKDIAEVAMKDFRENNSLMQLERGLRKHVLEKSVLMLHQDILSVNVILGYMFAKEIEVRNLRIIVKSKKFGLDEKFMEKELIA